MVEGPSPVQVYLRAGWSLGNVQERYVSLPALEPSHVFLFLSNYRERRRRPAGGSIRAVDI